MKKQFVLLSSALKLRLYSNEKNVFNIGSYSSTIDWSSIFVYM